MYCMYMYTYTEFKLLVKSVDDRSGRVITHFLRKKTNINITCINIEIAPNNYYDTSTYMYNYNYIIIVIPDS